MSKPAGVELATLTRFDIPAIASLTLVAYGTDETAENLVEAVEELRMTFSGAFGRVLDNLFVGAWQDGELVGAILTTVDPPWDDLPKDEPFIVDLVVNPKVQSKGIATALIGEVASRAGDLGYSSIGMRFNKAYTRAAQLYDYLGFEALS